MKWLAPFLCLWATTAFAQQKPPAVTFEAPLIMTCSTVSPEAMLKREYGEIPFVNGTARFVIADGTMVEGQMQIYVDPSNERSYTIIMTVDDLNCMILSGEAIQPGSGKGGKI